MVVYLVHEGHEIKQNCAFIGTVYPLFDLFFSI